MNPRLAPLIDLLARHRPAPIAPRCHACNGVGFVRSRWHNDPDTYSCDDCESCGGSGVRPAAKGEG